VNILYLTWGEVVTNAGVFDNQVLEQVKCLKQVAPDHNIWVISGMPLINRQRLLKRAGFLEELERIRASFGQAGIHFDTRWILAVARWFFSRFYHLPFYMLGQSRYLRRFTTENEIDIVHCRGYHAARVALQVRQKYSLPYRIVFDTRGLFPEEGVLLGEFGESSRSYRLWKQIEQQLLNECEAIVNVSDTFSEYIKTVTPNPNVYTVFTSTNIDLFRPIAGQKRSIRRQLGINHSCKVLVYLGSIHPERGWHTVANLVKVFEAFATIFPNAYLLLVTRFSHQILAHELSQYNFMNGRFTLIAGKSPQETNAYLQAGDYAVLPLRPVNNKITRLIGYTMVASKTGEYLAVGLPVIVNQAVGGAAALIEKYGVGCVYQVGREAELIDALSAVESNYADISQMCRTVAESTFSAKGNGTRYFQIYGNILNEANGAR
jgi:glycosyltransferase involved in cell wall biosynthesis